MSLFEQLKKQAGMILAAGAGADPAVAGEAAASHSLMSGVVDMMARQGLGPILQGFEDKGLGDIVSTWVGHGANQPISPEQVQHGLGPEMIDTLAARVGLPPGQAAALLSQFLPGIVDKLTPNGTVEGQPETPGPDAVAVTEN
jgi:uncharacterized protein YidB (DUF937 family)